MKVISGVAESMDVFSADRLKGLLGRFKGPCVSLYLPTHRTITETGEDRIRLKNLIRESESRLEALGHRSSDARGLLEPAARLLEDDLFWKHLADGLAILISKDQFHAIRLPLRFPERVVVTDRFYLKPLLPLFTQDGRFYVLALSQNQLRLLEGARDTVHEVNLQNVPKSLAEALKYDVLEKQLQVHGGGPRVGMFHGHDPGSADFKENIHRYFQQVDKGLHELLREQHVPLVLAGVDYLLPIYREANTYPHLLEKGITGNFDRVIASELHDQAWPIVQPHFSQALDAALARYEKEMKVGKTFRHVEKLLPAAQYGRIDTLFVAEGTPIWGLFKSADDKVVVHPEVQPGDEDLSDIAAMLTILNGGTVHPVPPARMPERAKLAAILRY